MSTCPRIAEQSKGQRGSHFPGFWGYWRYLRRAGSCCMWCFGNGVWLFWNGLFRDCLQHSNIESYSLCCLWVNIKLLLINAARAVTKETGNTGQGYIFLKAVYCNHFRQTVDIFLLSLCVIHRHVARATTKGGVPRCAVVTFNCKSCTVLKTSPYRTVQQQLVTHLPRW